VHPDQALLADLGIPVMTLDGAKRFDGWPR
jgi:hypothetical protein